MTTTPPTLYYAQTMPGVEKIAWLEIRSRLPKAHLEQYLFAKEQNGIVQFSYEGSPADTLQLRTAEDVFLQALSLPKVQRTRQDLTLFSNQIATAESVGRAVNQLMRLRQYSRPPTYRVIGRQYGKFGYERWQLVKAVLEGLARRYPKWTPVADDSQVEFWANLLGSHFLLGLRLSNRAMRHRFTNKVELPASLRPSVAAAMVWLTDPQPDDVFLDPLSGSGTLLMERIQAAPYRQLLGGDILPDRVQATRQNVPARQGDAPISIRQWDAQQLPLDDASVDKVATNFPFGKQISAPAELPGLYMGILRELQRVVRPGGRIVLLSSEYDLVKETVRQLPRLSINTGYSIAVLGQWGRIYIIDVNK
jgi:23S rRNA G2445 N2-methylase RlmL